jgi:hypothetical protein
MNDGHSRSNRPSPFSKTIAFILTAALVLAAKPEAARAQITITQIGSGTAGSGTTVSATLTGNITAGNSILLALVLVVNSISTAGPVTVSDPASNSYTIDAEATISTGETENEVRTMILASHNVKALTTGQTITVTHPSVNRGSALNVFEVTGLDVNPLDQTSTNTDEFVNSLTTGFVTTTSPDELLFAAFGDDDGSSVSFTADPGQTPYTRVQTSSVGLSVTSQIVSSVITYEATGTTSGNVLYAAVLATYKAPAAVVPVELSAFEAMSADGAVKLSWSTAAEIENFGFNVFRNAAANGEYEKINTRIIPGAGNSTEPQHYAYVDANVTPGNTYWYKLQNVDFNGNSKFHGPVPVTVEATTTVAETVAGTPTEFGLMQNYPNPLSPHGRGVFDNPSTVISFQLPVNSQVKLAIYNTAGQLIRELTSGEFASGKHNVTWDGLDGNGERVGSGVYLYRIEADSFVSMKKMILTK